MIVQQENKAVERVLSKGRNNYSMTFCWIMLQKTEDVYYDPWCWLYQNLITMKNT